MKFYPYRSPNIDARLRRIEEHLAALPPFPTNGGPAALVRSAQASPGAAGTASGGAGSGGALLNGDVAGPSFGNLVQAFNTAPITWAAPAAGQVLTSDGTQWLNRNWVAGPFGVGGSPVDGTWEAFSTHLSLYLTDTFSAGSGARGLHLNRLSHLDGTSHAYIFEVEGVPLWTAGMDYDTGATGRADYIPVFDNSANGGVGADVFRWSGEADAPGGTSQTCKFVAGRVVGTPRTFTHFGFFNGGDNTTGLGGIGIAYFDESASFDALTLANRSTNKKRTLVNFNSQYLLGADRSNANAQSFALYDSVLAADVFSVDSAGTITHPLKTTCNGVLTINITNDNGLVLKNTGIGGLYLEQETVGLKRTVINLNNLFQWGTDLGFNGSSDFWMQNQSTGNEFLVCDVHDKVTLGTTAALGGVIVAPASGKLGFYGAAPISQPTGTTDLRQALINLGLYATGGATPLNLNGGGLTTTGILSSAQIATSPAADGSHALLAKGHSATQSATIFEVETSAGGFLASIDNTGAVVAVGQSLFTGISIGPSGIKGNASQNTALSYGLGTISFAADANLTATNTQYANTFLSLTSAVALTATRNLVVPVQSGAFFFVRNGTTGAQSVQIIGTTGTGVTIANGKTAMVYCDGANYLRATPDI